MLRILFLLMFLSKMYDYQIIEQRMKTHTKIIIFLIVINLASLTNGFNLHKVSHENVENIANPEGGQCNDNIYEYHNIQSLSKSNLLEKIMKKFSQNTQTLSNITFWKGTNYRITIFDIKLQQWQFNPTNQTFEVLNSDTFKLTNGSINLSINYKWQIQNTNKQSPEYYKGTGQSQSFSVNCSFTIRVLNTGRLWLMDFTYPSFQLAYGSIDGDKILEYWQLMIYQLLSSNTWVGSAMYQLNYLIKFSFLTHASEAISDSFLIVNEYFPYQWNYGPKNQAQQQKDNAIISSTVPNKSLSLIIPITRRISEINLQKDEINISYESFIPNNLPIKCGSQLPKINLNPKQFGGSQQFISLSLFSELLDYAIENQLLKTDLNNQNWGTEIFNFTAKPLYPIFYRLSMIFRQNDPVSGFCKIVGKNQDIIRNSNTTAELKITSNCSLSVKDQKIYDFSLQIQLEIKGKALSNSLEFKIKTHKTLIKSDNDSYGFKIINPELAQKFINQSLKRLNDRELFGSGWPLNTYRKNPFFMIDKDYMFISDLATIKNREK